MPTVSDLYSKLHRDARASLEQSLESGETAQILILGEGKQALIGTDRRAFVFKKGMLSGAVFGKQFNSWDYRNLSGVELKRGMTIQAVVLQAPGVQPVLQVGRLSKGPNSAWEAPNAIMVNSSVDVSGPVSLLRQLIATHQAREQSTSSSAPAADPIEQVKRLAELKDAGILTPEEFETKKRELLGL